MNAKSIFRGWLVAVIVPFAVAAVARPIAAQEDAAQLQADRMALQREVKRLKADEAKQRSDEASGRMSAESKDAYAVYTARQWIKGERTDIAADTPGSLQMKADNQALYREAMQLQAAAARLESDAKAGRMAAVSDDSERVYRDRQAVNAEQKQVTADRAKLASDKQFE